MRTKLLTLFALLVALPIGAQTIVGDRVRLNTGACVLSSGSGSPEGVVTAPVCSMYINTASGVWYTKWTGTGNTGWGVGHNTNATVNGTLTVTGNVLPSGAFVSQNPGWASGVTGWAIGPTGTADFRFIYTDELHAKSFIADLEQALAGGQIITKSVAVLANNFTCPAASGVTTLTVEDLPSAPAMQVFVTGDYVVLRSFARAAGSLTIGDCVGTVTSPMTPGGTQSWTFTRLAGANAGTMPATTVVVAKSLVLDYGVTGNGYYEVNAIDGAYGLNSPYSQTVKWTTSPVAANKTVMTRLGNLRGVTGNTDEYGLFASNGNTTATGQYLIASNLQLQLLNTDIHIYNGGVQTIELNHAAPYLSLGASAPTAYGTGAGIWMGNDGGTYKFRAGIPGGAGVFWDGSTLTVRGTAGSGRNLVTNSECRVGTEGYSFFTTAAGALTSGTNNGGAGDYTPAYPVIENSTCFLTVSGTPTAGQVSGMQYNGQAFPVVAGRRYELSASLGVYRTSYAYTQINWLNAVGGLISSSFSANCPPTDVYRTGLGGFCQSSILADAPALAVTANIYAVILHDGVGVIPFLMWTRLYFGEATSTQTVPTAWGPAGVTEVTGGLIRTGTIVAGHIAAGTITATQIASGTITATQIAANTITAAKIASGTITATEIASDAITSSKINAGAVTAGKISVSTLSAITANIGTVTAGTINFGTNFSADSSGLHIAGSTFSAFSGHAYISSSLTVEDDILTGSTDLIQGGRVEATDYFKAVNMNVSTGTPVVWVTGGELKKDTSSIRYKENIRDANVDALSVLHVRPIRYDYINGTKNVVGLSAEDLAAVSPDLVNVDEEGRPESVRQQSLNVYLIQAIKALRTEIESMK